MFANAVLSKILNYAPVARTRTCPAVALLALGTRRISAFADQRIRADRTPIRHAARLLLNHARRGIPSRLTALRDLESPVAFAELPTTSRRIRPGDCLFIVPF